MPARKTPAPKTGRAAETAVAPPENAALDNALYLPRLDLIALPEAMMAGAGPDYSMILESICGVSDDSQAVEQYDGTLGVSTAFVTAHQKPVAQVQWNDNLGAVFTNPGNVNGVRWGSGTMIGPDLFLTCGHLFDADPNGWVIPRQNGTANAISPQDVAVNMHLNFLFQVDSAGVQRPEQRFPITQLIEFRLGGLDMALCRIGGSPGNTYGWTAFSTTDAAQNDMLAIIGHPAGQPKRIEAGPCTSISGSVIRYNDIDTLGGNSGSGILHASTGRVVGVHTNGGCNAGGTGSNSGVAIAAIVAVSPTLQALTPSSRSASGDDLLGTPLGQDVSNTLRSADTLSVLDRLGTLLARDIGTTFRAADTGARDQLGTIAAGDFGTFGGGDDPNNTLVETITDPGSVVVINPAVNRGGAVRGAGVRPFVQAGPSIDLGGEVADEVSPGELVLAQLEEAIVAQSTALASLQAAYAALAGTELDV